MGNLAEKVYFLHLLLNCSIVSHRFVNIDFFSLPAILVRCFIRLSASCFIIFKLLVSVAHSSSSSPSLSTSSSIAHVADFMHRPHFFLPLLILLSTIYPACTYAVPVIAGRERAYCFGPSANSNYRINVSDCYRAIHDLYSCPNPAAAITFSPHPIAGQRGTPWVVRFGYCSIIVDMLESSDNTQTTLAAIGTTALTVIRQCVEAGTEHGGWMFVGGNQLLSVSVRGTVSNQPAPAMQCSSGF